MKQYYFERTNIPTQKSGYVPHRGIIESKAKEGWKYIGSLPTQIDEDGIVRSIDLIFEKDAKEEIINK